MTFFVFLIVLVKGLRGEFMHLVEGLTSPVLPVSYAFESYCLFLSVAYLWIIEFLRLILLMCLYW